MLHLRRAEADQELIAGVPRAAVVRHERRRVRIEREHPTQSDVYALVFHDVADITDRVGPEPENVVVDRVLVRNDKFVPVLLHPLDPAEYGVFSEREIALDQERVSGFALFAVLPP